MRPGRSSSCCAVVAALALAACGRIGFDGLGGDDAGDDDDDAAPRVPPFTINLGGVSSGLRSVAELPDGRHAVIGFVDSAVSLDGIPLTAFGGTDILLAMVNVDGSVAWARTFGSSADDDGWSVAVGTDGALYLTGEIRGPVNFGGGALVPQGYNPFIASFTADGAYRWARRFGGNVGSGLVETGFRITAAANGDVLVAGRVEGTTDFGDGMQTASASGAQDGFVIRVRPGDGSLVWKQRWPAPGGSIVFDVVEDASGNVYAVGMYQGATSFGGGQVPFRGGEDVAVVSYTSAGVHRWTRTFGGPGSDWGFGARVIGQTVYVVGYYASTVDLGIPTSNGLADAFIASYALDGTPGWARGFGGPGCDLLSSVRDAGTEIVAGGMFSGTLDVGAGPHTATAAGDALLVTLTPAGQTTWSKAFGDTGDDAASITIGTRPTGLYTVGVTGMDLGADCLGYPFGGRGFLHHL